MPLPVLSDSEWKELREMSEIGHDDSYLAKQFNVTTNAIRKRRCDDKKRGNAWLTPKEREKALALKAVEEFYQNKPVHGTTLPVNLAPVTEVEMTEIRGDTPGQIARAARTLLLQGLSFLRVPTTLDDFNKLHNIFMKAAGLDKQGVAIQINNSGMDWSSQGAKEKPMVVVSSSPLSSGGE